jgi:hypothetical protein
MTVDPPPCSEEKSSPATARVYSDEELLKKFGKTYPTGFVVTNRYLRDSCNAGSEFILPIVGNVVMVNQEEFQGKAIVVELNSQSAMDSLVEVILIIICFFSNFLDWKIKQRQFFPKI